MNYKEVLRQYQLRTNFFLDPLLDEDWFKTFQTEDKELNNLAWIVGHLAVSQNFLLGAMLDMPRLSIAWAKQFGMGSENAKKDTSPTQEEIYQTWKDSCGQALENLEKMNREEYAKPNKYEMKLPYEDKILSKEESIIQGLWHTANHTGQIATLAKLYGKKGI